MMCIHACTIKSTHYRSSKFSTVASACMLYTCTRGLVKYLKMLVNSADPEACGHAKRRALSATCTIEQTTRPSKQLLWSACGHLAVIAWEFEGGAGMRSGWKRVYKNRISKSKASAN